MCSVPCPDQYTPKGGHTQGSEAPSSLELKVTAATPCMKARFPSVGNEVLQFCRVRCWARGAEDVPQTMACNTEPSPSPKPEVGAGKTGQLELFVPYHILCTWSHPLTHQLPSNVPWTLSLIHSISSRCCVPIHPGSTEQWQLRLLKKCSALAWSGLSP